MKVYVIVDEKNEQFMSLSSVAMTDKAGAGNNEYYAKKQFKTPIP